MIIGICGHKGAGKSTVSEVAINLTRSPHNFARIGFSDTMTRMFLAFGIPEEIVWNKARWDEPLSELSGKTLRFAYLSLGEEWGRNTIGRAVWINRAIGRAEELQARKQTPIIDNVRYPDEAQAILDRGGKIIAFHNPHIVPDLSHPSEKHIPEIQATMCAYKFTNGGPLADSAEQFFILLGRLANAY